MESEKTVSEDGTIFYKLNGKLHREDGPAIEFSDGTKWWFLHDDRHRLDGPAIEHSDGYKEWWINYILVNPTLNNFSFEVLMKYGELSPVEIAQYRIKNEA